MKFKVGDKVKSLEHKSKGFSTETIGVITKILVNDISPFPYRVESVINGTLDYWWYGEDELELYTEEQEKEEEPKQYIKYDEEFVRAYCELRQNAERNNPYTGNSERFMKDAEKYLHSIFACNNLEVPEYQVKMIATYLANRMIVTLNDCLYERDKEWKQSMKRGGYPVGQYEHSKKRAGMTKDELNDRVIGLIQDIYASGILDVHYGRDNIYKLPDWAIRDFVYDNAHWKIICEKLNLK